MRHIDSLAIPPLALNTRETCLQDLNRSWIHAVTYSVMMVSCAGSYADEPTPSQIEVDEEESDWTVNWDLLDREIVEVTFTFKQRNYAHLGLGLVIEKEHVVTIRDAKVCDAVELGLSYATIRAANRYGLRNGPCYVPYGHMEVVTERDERFYVALHPYMFGLDSTIPNSANGFSSMSLALVVDYVLYKETGKRLPEAVVDGLSGRRFTDVQKELWHDYYSPETCKTGSEVALPRTFRNGQVPSGGDNRKEKTTPVPPGK